MDERDCVLIAGGSGITPVMSVLRTTADDGDSRRLTVLYFSRDAEDVAFADELEQLSEATGTSVLHIPSRPAPGWDGPSGRVDERVLDSVLPADRHRWAYFVCGPPAMTDAAVGALARLGVSPGAIRAERFALA